MPDLPVDAEELRAQVRIKYREVAVAPGATYHFHTGRDLASRLGYDARRSTLPDAAVESFAGVGNPLRCGPAAGDGWSTSAPVAASKLGALPGRPEGRVVGVDMTDGDARKVARDRERSATSRSFRTAG